MEYKTNLLESLHSLTQLPRVPKDGIPILQPKHGRVVRNIHLQYECTIEYFPHNLGIQNLKLIGDQSQIQKVLLFCRGILIDSYEPALFPNNIKPEYPFACCNHENILPPSGITSPRYIICIAEGIVDFSFDCVEMDILHPSFYLWVDKHFSTKTLKKDCRDIIYAYHPVTFIRLFLPSDSRDVSIQFYENNKYYIPFDQETEMTWTCHLEKPIDFSAFQNPCILQFESMKKIGNYTVYFRHQNLILCKAYGWMWRYFAQIKERFDSYP
jgi:hypothetical protein